MHGKITVSSIQIGLHRYIGSVIPAEEACDTLRPRPQALGADLAASMVAQRFALPTSNGIQQLCKEVGLRQAAASIPGPLPGHEAAAEVIIEQVAAALVSVVDRAANSSEQSLCREQFVPHVMQQLALIASAPQALSATDTETDSSTTPAPHIRPHDNNSTADRHIIALISDVSSRFCRRGFANLVAQALWNLLLRHGPSSDRHSTYSQTQQQPEADADLHPQQQPQTQISEPMMAHEPSQNSLKPSVCESVSLREPSQRGVCALIHAVRDPGALEKLLTCLLSSAATDTRSTESAELLHAVVQPMWDRDTVRYALILPLEECKN